jgi:hypothetical protein
MAPPLPISMSDEPSAAPSSFAVALSVIVWSPNLEVSGVCGVQGVGDACVGL